MKILINLLISTDGASVSKSAPSHLCPITFSVSNVIGLSRKVLNAGLYHVPTKPSSSNSFLRPLIFKNRQKGLSLILKNTIPDNCVCLDDNSIFLLENFILEGEKHFLLVEST